jgi:hypothetical protein
MAAISNTTRASAALLMLTATVLWACDPPEPEEAPRERDAGAADPAAEPAPTCEDDADVEDQVCDSFESSYFNHPFQSVAGSEDGAVPLLDVKDDPEGRRYAAVDRAYTDSEEGPATHYSGIVTLEQFPLSGEFAEIGAPDESRSPPVELRTVSDNLRHEAEGVAPDEEFRSS